jgi:ATP-dependent DNA helicase RecG
VLPDELADIVSGLRQLGSDDSETEAKRAESTLPRSVRYSLSAFANTGGGVLILGLDEAAGFAATGVANPAKLSADLASVASDEMEPALRLVIKTHRFEGVSLVVAEVPALDPDQRPCFYKAAGMNQGSYVRVGDGNRKLSSYEVTLILANRGQPREDEVVLDLGEEALDSKLVGAFVERVRERRPHAFGNLSVAQALELAKVMRADRVTLAGLLALGEYPQQHLPQLMVTFVSYPTVRGADLSTGERFLDNVAAEGPIPVMVRDTLAALRRNMSRRATVQGPGRVDTWEYPEPALREAVTNALVHRDYSSAARGTQVQLEMYPDRLEIRNPGGLFGPVTADGLGEEALSSSRNATLLKILEDVPIPGTDRAVCENRGTGIRIMIAALRNAAMSPPRFADRIASFSVTFGNHTLMSAAVVEWIRGLGEIGLTDSQCLGLAMLRNGEILDNKVYRSANNLDSREATTELGDLVARGLVRQSGGRRWARYELESEVVEPVGPNQPARRRDRRADIVKALGANEMSRAKIADVLKIPDKTVLRWLGIMRQEGTVQLVGGATNSIHARYRLTGVLRLEDAMTDTGD